MNDGEIQRVKTIQLIKFNLLITMFVVVVLSYLETIYRLRFVYCYQPVMVPIIAWLPFLVLKPGIQARWSIKIVIVHIY